MCFTLSSLSVRRQRERLRERERELHSNSRLHTFLVCQKTKFFVVAKFFALVFFRRTLLFTSSALARFLFITFISLRQHYLVFTYLSGLYAHKRTRLQTSLNFFSVRLRVVRFFSRVVWIFNILLLLFSCNFGTKKVVSVSLFLIISLYVLKQCVDVCSVFYANIFVHCAHHLPPMNNVWLCLHPPLNHT